jgi:hypothetical protein
LELRSVVDHTPSKQQQRKFHAANNFVEGRGIIANDVYMNVYFRMTQVSFDIGNVSHDSSLSPGRANARFLMTHCVLRLKNPDFDGAENGNRAKNQSSVSRSRR